MSATVSGPCGAPEGADAAELTRVLPAEPRGFEAWHDGTGYPLDGLDTLDAADRERLCSQWVVRGWREVEVLAAVGTPAARAMLRAGFDAAGVSRLEIGLALLRCSPDLLSEDERSDLVCQAIAQARGGQGLDAALAAALAWHPAPVMRALWQALMQPDAVVVVHVAALLHHLHGLAGEPFDLAQRSEFLRFADDDPNVRAAANERLRQATRQSAAATRPSPPVSCGRAGIGQLPAAALGKKAGSPPIL